MYIYNGLKSKWSWVQIPFRPTFIATIATSKNSSVVHTSVHFCYTHVIVSA